MKREAFEAMVLQALDGLAGHIIEDAANHKRKRRKVGIGGVRYGEAAKLVGQAVSRLVAPGRPNKPVPAPSPDMVPPCF